MLIGRLAGASLGAKVSSIKDSVRGYDLYIMVDVTNYSMTYSLCGQTNHMSPDDHYADAVSYTHLDVYKRQHMVHGISLRNQCFGKSHLPFHDTTSCYRM